MKGKLKKMLCVIMCVLATFSCASISLAAVGVMTQKEHWDNGYCVTGYVCCNTTSFCWAETQSGTGQLVKVVMDPWITMTTNVDAYQATSKSYYAPTKATVSYTTPSAGYSLYYAVGYFSLYGSTKKSVGYAFV